MMRPRWGQSVWVLLAAALIGCPNGGGGPGTGNPPQISISLDNADAIGTSTSAHINYSGCAGVNQLLLLNHGQLVKSLTPGAPPLLVTLTSADVSFDAGIPAQLSLTADITCSDGRHNVSGPADGSFFPAAAVYANVDGSPIVPDFFYAEGSGTTVTFVGCALQPVSLAPELVRVNLSGTITQADTRIGNCDDTTFFSPLSVGGVRWMATPGKSAVAYDSNLNLLAVARDIMGATLAPLGMTEAPTGAAFISATGGAGYPDLYLAPVTPADAGCGPNLWCISTDQPIGSPVVDPARTNVFVPAFNATTASSGSFESIERSFANGAAVGTVSLFQFTNTVGNPWPPFTASYDPGASTIFVPYPLPTAGAFALRAADAATGALHWQNQSLLGNPEAAVPYGDGGFLAAVADNQTWFLESATGAVVGPSAAPALLPAAGLTTTYVQPGNGTDFYILDSPPNPNGGYLLPTEVVATDNPAKGELFRYQLPSGSVSLALDNSGRVWLRVGPELVKLLPLTTYRQLHGG